MYRSDLATSGHSSFPIDGKACRSYGLFAKMVKPWQIKQMRAISGKQRNLLDDAARGEKRLQQQLLEAVGDESVLDQRPAVEQGYIDRPEQPVHEPRGMLEQRLGNVEGIPGTQPAGGFIDDQLLLMGSQITGVSPFGAADLGDDGVISPLAPGLGFQEAEGADEVASSLPAPAAQMNEHRLCRFLMGFGLFKILSDLLHHILVVHPVTGVSMRIALQPDPLVLDQLRKLPAVLRLQAGASVPIFDQQLVRECFHFHGIVQINGNGCLRCSRHFFTLLSSSWDARRLT
ncbi:hypothetical protein BN871_CH_00110 [Paenibacillus sp. P22]|nr:hypothetical protein BN871_CH_00110 [Paenibacillus sp. P22]